MEYGSGVRVRYRLPVWPAESSPFADTPKDTGTLGGVQNCLVQRTTGGIQLGCYGNFDFPPDGHQWSHAASTVLG